MEKIIVAVGGTGGHLLPAQRPAKRLQDKNPNIEIIFLGAKLSTSLFFKKSEYCYLDIPAAPIFKNFKIFSKGIFFK